VLHQLRTFLIVTVDKHADFLLRLAVIQVHFVKQ
jgi:hypothetical protein